MIKWRSFQSVLAGKIPSTFRYSVAETQSWIEFWNLIISSKKCLCNGKAFWKMKFRNKMMH